MSSPTKQCYEPSLARTVAPEDIVRGDYLALLSVEFEYPLLVWLCDPPMPQQGDVVRLRLRNQLCRDPLRVCEVCLPFVFVKRPGGKGGTLDVRQCELARLDKGYGRRVWKALAGERANQPKSKKKK